MYKYKKFLTIPLKKNHKVHLEKPGFNIHFRNVGVNGNVKAAFQKNSERLGLLYRKKI